jgi:hypothetical protein
VFERLFRGHVRRLCEAALHEIGHALGLDHAYDCADPMSYLSGCGRKHFQDREVDCGEYEPRPCESGMSQNSHQHLLLHVGPRHDRGRPRRAHSPPRRFRARSRGYSGRRTVTTQTRASGARDTPRLAGRTPPE